MTEINEITTIIMKKMTLSFLVFFAALSISAAGLRGADYHIESSLQDKECLAESLPRVANSSTFHLFSHGRAGELLINGKWLNAKQIAEFISTDAINRVSTINRVSAFKNLYIYGCEFAKGPEGKQAVWELQNALGMKVAASTNITGADGDWHLEEGNVQVRGLEKYAHNLACPDPLNPATCDTDSDGVLNNDDIDDDNDGVLDTTEGYVKNSFESSTRLLNRTSIEGWTATAGSFDIFPIGDPVVAPVSEGNSTLDLMGANATTTPATIEKTFTTTIGSNYEFKLDYADFPGGAGSQIEIVVVPSFVSPPVITASTVYQTQTIQFTASAASTKIEIRQLTPPSNLGTLIDNFRLYVDSDSDTVFDHLDLDSDNDGIPDNVEAQLTSVYTAPNNDLLGTFSTNDGLNSAYITNGTAGYPYNGILPIDTDADGIPDYLDEDADGDSMFDVDENFSPPRAFISGSVGTNGLGSNFESLDLYADVNGEAHNGTSFNLADTDNDVQVAEESGAWLFNNSDYDYRDVSNITLLDRDQDGIYNYADIDDDNDGILDVNEGIFTNYTTADPSFDTGTPSSTTPNQQGDTTGWDNTLSVDLWTNVAATTSGGTPPSSTLMSGMPNSPQGGNFIGINYAVPPLNATSNFEKLRTNLQNIVVGSQYTVSFFVANGGYRGDVIGRSPRLIMNFQGIEFATPGIPFDGAGKQRWYYHEITFTATTTSGDIEFYVDPSSVDNATEVANLAVDAVYVRDANGSDPDGDGVSNELDLDSDNDGIPDNIEAQSTANYVMPSAAPLNNTTDQNRDGLDDRYHIGQGVSGRNADNTYTHTGKGLTPVDTDFDLTPDFLDTNSDNDTLDDIEENYSPAQTFIASASSVGVNGLENNSSVIESADDYSDVNGLAYNDLSRVFTLAKSSPVVQNNGLDAIPLARDFAYRMGPDTDLDGVPDSIDIDDDNDGILDDVENAFSLSILDDRDLSSGKLGTLSAGTNNIGTIYQKGLDGVNVVATSSAEIVPLFTSTGSTIDGITAYRLLSNNSLTMEFSSLLTGNPLGVKNISFMFSDFEGGVGEGLSSFYYVTSDGTRVDYGGANGWDGWKDVAGRFVGEAGSNLSVSSGNLRSNYVTEASADDNKTARLDVSDLKIIEFGVTTLTGGSGFNIGFEFMPLFAELDADADGFKDALDLDTDNDGIPDNVEAQTTVGYRAPDYSDNDNDGLMDEYDADDNDISKAASVGLLLIDTDSDRTPDYFDLDSDGDNMNDVDENFDAARSITVVSNNGLSDNAEVGGIDNGYTDVNGEAYESGAFQLADTYVLPVNNDYDYREIIDTDGDLLPNNLDIDDDNDGIIDSIENTVMVDNITKDARATGNASFSISGNNINMTSTLGAFTASFISDNVSSYLSNVQDFELSFSFNGSQSSFVGINAASTNYLTNPEDIDFSIYMRGASEIAIREGDQFFLNQSTRTSASDIFTIRMQPDGTVTYLKNGVVFRTSLPTVRSRADDYYIDASLNSQAGSSIENITLTSRNITSNFQVTPTSSLNSTLDLDNDGLINSLDPDSDDDGCPDMFDGAGDFLTFTLIPNMELPDGPLPNGSGNNIPVFTINQDVASGAVNAQGLPTVVETQEGAQGQGVGFSQDATQQDSQDCDRTDTDMDGVPDNIDIDDDNDGILDIDECNFRSDVYSAVNSAETIDIPLPISSIGETITISNFWAQGDFESPGEVYSISFNGGPVQNNLGGAGIGDCQLGDPFAQDTAFVDTQVTIIDIGGGVPGIQATVAVSKSGNGGLDVTLTDCGYGNSYLDFQFDYLFSCDLDNDGIINSLDPDSDDDGCPDMYDGAGNYASEVSNGTLPDGPSATNPNSLTPVFTFGDPTKVDDRGVPYLSGGTDASPTTPADQAVGDSQDPLVQDPQDCPQCEANAGTLEAPSTGNEVCFDTINNNAIFNALVPTTNTKNVLTDYEVHYVLTTFDGTNNIIQQVQPEVTPEVVPNFTVTTPGDYTIHTLVAETTDTASADYLDLSTVTLGTTTAADVSSLLIQGGGAICGSLDTTGVTIAVLDPTDPRCADTDGDNVPDADDIDDDNDGILDVDEGIINIAPSGTARQSSNFDFRYTADKAIDGIKTDGLNISHTNLDNQPYWDLDLGSSYSLSHLLIYNYQDSYLGNNSVMLSNTEFSTSDPSLATSLSNSDFTYTFPSVVPASTTIRVDLNNTSARYIRIQSPITEYLVFYEVEVMKSDSDDDGVIDSLDLDSDNDGIPDNIEAQATQSYIVPSGFPGGVGADEFIDLNGDGLDDIYDSVQTNITGTNATGSYTHSGTGLTPVDTDGDLIPDFLEDNSDDDGLNDVEENYPSLIPVSNASVGANGLENAAENNDGYVDVNGNAHNGTIFLLANTDDDVLPNGSNASPGETDFDYRDNRDDTDTDGDDVIDVLDLDDDNDGILDFDESHCFSTVSNFDTATSPGSTTPLGSLAGTGWSQVDSADAWINVAGTVYGDPDNIAAGMPNSPQGGAFVAFLTQTYIGYKEAGFTFVTGLVPGNVYELAWWQANAGHTNATSRPLSPTGGLEITMDDSTVIEATKQTFRGLGSQVWERVSTRFVAPNTSIKISFSATSNSYIAVDDVILVDITCQQGVDLDNDGIPNHLDPDSDDDGCPDAYDGDGDFFGVALTHNLPDGPSTNNPSANPVQVFTSTVVDGQGVPTIVQSTIGTQSQGVGFSQNPSSFDTVNNDCSDCEPNGAGVLEVDSANSVVCIDQATNQAIISNVTVTADTNQQRVVPAGYEAYYLLVDDSGVIVQISGALSNATENPSFTITGALPFTLPSSIAGNYTVHTLVFDASSETLSNVAAVGENLSTDVQPRVGFSTSNLVCGSLDATGASITVADPTNDLCDWDGDNYSNVDDLDDDNDGILDAIEDTSGAGILDTDGDNLPNQFDPDSDGDGCPDALEGDETFTPSDLDGFIIKTYPNP